MIDNEPTPPHDRSIARALLVCIQMISEPARYRYIEGEIVDMEQPLPDGSYRQLFPDDLMMEFQTNWGSISANVQSATFGVFPDDVRLALDPRDPLIFDTVASEKYSDGNQVILWPCGNNKVNQLWTLSSEDNTIRSNGKCLVTYGYNSGSYVMIYDCDAAVPNATKWEIHNDGAIRHPRSGLVLTENKDSSGTTILVLDYLTNASKQVFYASRYASSPITTIVSYEGQCLQASGSQGWLKKCSAKDAEQQWAI
ncbi:ricin-like [Hibiscus syriacus]|uniref:ricin-like n=1 Tax=Hibiscus syriacus TaxID=106335 RepID=UPI001923E5FB|nr:ricin-like [Hibiscus syriacus]